MILLCDEDISPQVADTLQQRNYDARSFREMGWLSRLDTDWLPLAGQIADSMVLSCDRMMLTGAERDAIIANNVGIVFLTDGQRPIISIVQLLMNNWAQLEQLHNNTPRPFVKFLTIEGQLINRFRGRRLRTPAN